MPAGLPRSIRLTADEWQRLHDLGRELGPVKPLPPADVIRELLRRSKRPKKQKTNA